MTAQPVRRRGRPPRASTDQIADAALELFGTRGVAGTSIDAIARRVGLTDAGVLHHFGTKQALVDAAFRRGLSRQVERMRQLAAPGGLAAIRNFAAWGAVVEETPEFAAFQVAISHEGIHPDSPWHGYVVGRYADVEGLVTGLIAEGVARGEIRADVDADWEARAIVAYLDGIRLQWFYSGRALPMAQHVARYVEQLVARISA